MKERVNGYYSISRDEEGYVYEVRTRPNSTLAYTLYEGNKVLREGSLTYIYILDKLAGFIYNNSIYYYQRNILGDIVGIYDKEGVLINKYVYDGYGRHKVLTASLEIDSNETSLGNINPYRYRGYYYDKETQLYWVSSRYYSPELCRWIS